MKLNAKRIKSFVKGMGSVIDLMPNNNRHIDIKINKRSDKQALMGDWEKIGADINNVINKIEPKK